jgi:cell division protein FtsW
MNPIPPLPQGDQAVLRAASFPRVVGPPDRVLFVVLLAMMCWGVVMVYSASIPRAIIELHDGEFYFARQAGFAAIGVLMMSCLAWLDYHHLGRHALLLVGASAPALLGLLAGFGHEVNRAKRWYLVGPFSVQPAEFAKVALLIWLAQSLASKTGRLGDFWIGFFPHVLVASVLAGCCVLQPDFGSASFMMMTAFVMLAIAGVKGRPLMVAAAATVPLAAILVIHKPYRLHRVIDWASYWIVHGDMTKLSHQIQQSWRAIAAGGMFGLGLGESRRKFFYLPEAHTDFIAAVIAEELGLLGLGLLVFGFAWVVQRGVRAAHRAVDELGFLIGMGTSLFLGVQAITNLAVVLHIFPTKGLALPFFTYGGSSLLANAIAMGILLNVTRPREVASP